jgi:hypothetical protein
MIDPQFTILIGSCARGTGDASSDIDIVRVGHDRAVKKAQLGTVVNPGAPISYIDYDAVSFASLYEAGSLFVHHILTEGKLLDGDSVTWARLVKDFSVTNDFSVEISEQISLCTWLARPGAFTNATMPLLSHLFKALKNAAIFSLAQQQIYIYDKRESLRQAFHFLTDSDIELLVTANNAYERGIPHVRFPLEVGANLLSDLCARVAAGAGELS